MSTWFFHKSNEFRGRNMGFSLLELLVVIAIISVLSALTMPAISSIMGGRNIDQATNIAEDVISSARQRAISNGTMVALLLSPSSTNPSTRQNFLLLQASQGSSGVEWTGVASFVQLPPAVQLTPYIRGGVGGTVSFYTYSTSPGNSQFVPLPTQLNNHDLTGYSFIVFFPDGSVSAPASGPAINLQRANRTSADFIVLIQEDSGRAKVIDMQ